MKKTIFFSSVKFNIPINQNKTKNKILYWEKKWLLISTMQEPA